MTTITAAPMPATFQGNDYQMSPMTDSDYEELDNWIRAEILKLAKSTGDSEIVAIALRSIMVENWRSPSGLAIVNTSKGIAKLLEISLRKRHPKVTPDACGKLLKEAEDISEFHRVYSLLNFGTKDDDGDDDDSADDSADDSEGDAKN